MPKTKEIAASKQRKGIQKKHAIDNKMGSKIPVEAVYELASHGRDTLPYNCSQPASQEHSRTS